MGNGSYRGPNSLGFSGGVKANESTVQTQENWVLHQDPKWIGPAADPIFIGLVSGPNVL
jgi:hypothetical protein